MDGELKQSPLVPPLQSDVGPTIDELGDRTIVDSGRVTVVLTTNGKPSLLVEARSTETRTFRFCVPLTIEQVRHLRKALAEIAKDAWGENAAV